MAEGSITSGEYMTKLVVGIALGVFIITDITLIIACVILEKKYEYNDLDGEEE